MCHYGGTSLSNRINKVMRPLVIFILKTPLPFICQIKTHILYINTALNLAARSRTF